MRNIQQIIEKYGNPVFEMDVEQDKSMIDKDLWEISDIPSSIKAFLLHNDKRNTNLFNKYIVFCNYDNKDEWHPNSGKAILAREYIELKTENCFWKYDEDLDIYDSSCGDSFYFGTGNIKDNNFIYCPRCGKRIYEQ